MVGVAGGGSLGDLCVESFDSYRTHRKSKTPSCNRETERDKQDKGVVVFQTRIQTHSGWHQVPTAAPLLLLLLWHEDEDGTHVRRTRA